MDSGPKNVDAILCNAIEIETNEKRAAYLTEACDGNAELRCLLEQLIEDHFAAGSFLDRPALEMTTDPSVCERLGDQIGPYKLLQMIGEGGMGVVYMAEQREPVERQVALKIVKPGMDSQKIIARFEAERRALAMMDHPNIARVLDAGTTEAGRPYFVMELVKGVSITEYCDENHLTPRERLDLFIPVCQAVQHAHQKGIIHRDIKPSNVLVAEYDHHAVPKVIDFGVAKALHQRLTQKTLFTQYGQIVGTVEYMSPEQAKLNQLDVDTRTDVYSLGVLLYELLTGSTPLDRQRLNSAAFDEMLRIIREDDPPKPSTRISSSEALPALAQKRRVTPSRLGDLIRGDLDCIVMKSLDKDRNRRYETAHEFALDIQRHLAHEPVTAGRPTVFYRVRKWGRRNRALAFASLFVSMAVVFGLLVASVGLVQAWHERDRATALERKARDSQEISESSLNLFMEALGLSADLATPGNIEKIPKKDMTIHEYLVGVEQLISRTNHTPPMVEARVRYALGVYWIKTGEAALAIDNLRRTTDLCHELYGANSPECAQQLRSLGIALGQNREWEQSRDCFRRSLAISKELAQGKPSLGIAESLESLAGAERELGNLDDALSLSEQALALHPLLERTEQQRFAYGWALNTCASNFLKKKSFDRAEQMARKSVAVHGEEGNYLSESISLAVLVDVLVSQSRLPDALQVAKLRVEVARKASDSGNQLRSSLIDLASHIMKTADTNEPEVDREQICKLLREYLELCNDSADDVAKTWGLRDLSTNLEKLGRLSEAIAAAEQRVELTRECNKGGVGFALKQLGGLLVKLAEDDGNPVVLQRAEKCFSESAEIQHRLGQPANEYWALNGLVQVLQKQGRFDDAIQAARRGWEAALVVSDDVGPIKNAVDKVVPLEWQLQDYAAAEGHSRALLEKLREIQPDKPSPFDRLYFIAQAAAAQGKAHDLDDQIDEWLEQTEAVAKGKATNVDFVQRVSWTKLRQMWCIANRDQPSRQECETILKSLEPAEKEGNAAYTTFIWEVLCAAHDVLGDTSAAIQCARKSLDSVSPKDHFSYTACELRLIRLLNETGDLEQIEETYRKGLERRFGRTGEGINPKYLVELAFARANLATALIKLGKHNEAEPLLLAAQDTILDCPAIPAKRKLEIGSNLVAVYEASNQADKAAHWKERSRQLSE